MEYVSGRVDADEEAALGVSGVEEFDLDDALVCLAHEEWVNEREDRWFRELYSWLGRQERPRISQRLQRLAKLYASKGKAWHRSQKETFFLSSKGGHHYGFEHELRILKRSPPFYY